MKSATPTLLPLLRTRVQGEVLAWLILHPDHGYSITELANVVDASVPTVMREVDRLADAGLITSTRRGNQRVVQATTDHAIYRPLADLMAVTFGPIGVLREAFAEVEGVARAFIYGSWAARYHQAPGDVPQDLDVMVIGVPDRDDVYDAVEDAERRLRREVSVRVVSEADWDADDGAFKSTVLSQPVVELTERHDGD